MNAQALLRPTVPAILRNAAAASPLLWRAGIAFIAAFALCLIAQTLDPRLFNGISVWVKPAKFFLSLGLHMLTLAWGIALLPEDLRHSRSTTLASTTMASMAVLEMIYITFRAARAEASHFNESSELAGALYGAMGMGAALMMIATAWLGLAILRHGPRSALGIATGTGFIAAAILTLAAGFTLGAMGSHWIGGDQTDASGLPLLGWSTTGGDLRVSHFLATHLMQVLPLAAWIGGRHLALAAGLAGIGAVALTYAQALRGLPLFALQ